MTDNGDEIRKAKKPKRLVPVVQGRKRKTNKKHHSPTASLPQQPQSATFHELVEAANSDATWRTGSAPLRQRTKASVKTHLAFGGSTSSKMYEEGTPMSHHQFSFGIKQETEDMKEDVVDEDGMEDIHQPIFLNARLENDVEKLLPRYLEDRVLEMPSDGDETGTPEAIGLGSTSTDGGILLQLPSAFPYTRKKEEDTPDMPPLPEGKIGKLSIYKSGRVRLRMGDVSMDVNEGTPWPFHQQLVAINVRESDGHCVFLGDINKHAVCTLDITQLLQSDAVSHEEHVNERTVSVGEETRTENDVLMDGGVLTEASMREQREHENDIENGPVEMELEDDVTDNPIENEIGTESHLESAEEIKAMQLISNDRQTTSMES